MSYSDMEINSQQQIDERGWSDWQILAYGLDQTLLIELGNTIIDNANGSLEQIQYGENLLFLADEKEPEFYGAYKDYKDEMLEFHKSQQNSVEITFDWIKNNYSYVNSLKTKTGFPIMKIIGDAINFYGKYELNGWPGYDEYKGEHKYDQWRYECSYYGTIIAQYREEKIEETLNWLAKWHSAIWD